MGGEGEVRSCVCVCDVCVRYSRCFFPIPTYTPVFSRDIKLVVSLVFFYTLLSLCMFQHGTC